MSLRLVFNPLSGTFDYVNDTGGGGSGQTWQTDVTNESPNGVRTLFTTTASYLPGGIMVFLNGIREKHFTEIDASSFQFADAPQTGDEISMFIQTG